MAAARCALALLAALSVALAAKLPTEYPLCKKADPNINKCLHDNVKTALNLLKGGIPALGVPSVDPLKVDHLEIGQGSGPISINQKFSNVVVTGLGDSSIHEVKSDVNNYQIIFDGFVDTVLEADYELAGRILLLPITGKGRCRLVFTNLKATVGPKGKGVEKKGKTYFDVTDFETKIYHLDKLQVKFENLFNGDKTLGESMNNLLNENWKDLWAELRPAFEESFGQIFHQFSKRIFDKVPYNDIFIE